MIGIAVAVASSNILNGKCPFIPFRAITSRGKRIEKKLSR